MRGQKILLVTLDFWPTIGGVANYYFNLCRQFGMPGKVAVLTTQAQKHENTKTLKRKSAKTRKQGFNFKVVRRGLLVNWLWPRWLPMFWHIWRVVKREKIEILWVGEVLPTGTAVYFLSKILKLPYIVSCHGNDILQANKVARRRKMAQKILAGAKAIVVNSHYTGELTKNLGVESDKIKIIYPAIDYASIKALKHKSIKKTEFIRKYDLEGKKIILSIGRLVARKGFDKVIEAMPQVVVKIPQAVYLIAGEGPDMSRLKYLSTKALKHIIFLGRVSEEEKWALMELCDVFVMPARESREDAEGFGIVYLEAGLAGKPVVAGKSGGAQEAVVDKQTGLLVEPESIEGISAVVVELLNNKELASKLGQAGRQRALKEFNREKIGREFKESLEEIGIDNN